MNFIKIEGLTDVYPERIEGTSEWYCCKIANNCFCDMDEAAEIVRNGNVYEGMTCVLIHYPDGQVYYPFVAKENVYVDSPVFWEGSLYFLVADFSISTVSIVAFDTTNFEQKLVEEFVLEESDSWVNLRLEIGPVMLIRDGKEGCLEVLYPEKKMFKLGEREVIDFRDGDRVYFSQWFEEDEPDYNYYEEVIVRDWETGEELERFEGQMKRMPNGDIWVM